MRLEKSGWAHPHRIRRVGSATPASNPLPTFLSAFSRFSPALGAACGKASLPPTYRHFPSPASKGRLIFTRKHTETCLILISQFATVDEAPKNFARDAPSSSWTTKTARTKATSPIAAEKLTPKPSTSWRIRPRTHLPHADRVTFATELNLPSCLRSIRRRTALHSPNQFERAR